jgi:hypothetical protein
MAASPLVHGVRYVSPNGATEDTNCPLRHAQCPIEPFSAFTTAQMSLVPLQLRFSTSRSTVACERRQERAPDVTPGDHFSKGGKADDCTQSGDDRACSLARQTDSPRLASRLPKDTGRIEQLAASSRDRWANPGGCAVNLSVRPPIPKRGWWPSSRSRDTSRRCVGCAIDT